MPRQDLHVWQNCFEKCSSTNPIINCIQDPFDGIDQGEGVDILKAGQKLTTWNGKIKNPCLQIIISSPLTTRKFFLPFENLSVLIILPLCTLQTMLTIVWNIFQSLTERCSIQRIGLDLHLQNCLASPMRVAFFPSTFYIAQFSVVLKNATMVTPSTMVNPGTCIFISGHLSPSPPQNLSCIEVPTGDWFLHERGLGVDVEEKFRKALVYGMVYITEVCWDFENKWEIYVKVVDCLVGNVSGILFEYSPPCLCRFCQPDGRNFDLKNIRR